MIIYLAILFSYFIYFIAIIMALNQVGLTSAILNMLSGAVILLILISMILAIKDFVPNMVAGIFIFQKGIILRHAFTVSLGFQAPTSDPIPWSIGRMS